MLGARSKLETAVGSWPNWNTTNTCTTKTATETIAVRERNSTSRSFDATAHAWRSRSGDRIAIILRHLRRPARAAWGEMHEAAGAHECDLGRESRSFFHVVGHQHRRAARGGMLGEQAAERFRRLLAQHAAAGRASVLVTHNVEEGTGLATEVAFMRAGRFVHFAPRGARGPAQVAEDYRNAIA